MRASAYTAMLPYLAWMLPSTIYLYMHENTYTCILYTFTTRVHDRGKLMDIYICRQLANAYKLMHATERGIHIYIHMYHVHNLIASYTWLSLPYNM